VSLAHYFGAGFSRDDAAYLHVFGKHEGVGRQARRLDSHGAVLARNASPRASRREQYALRGHYHPLELSANNRPEKTNPEWLKKMGGESPGWVAALRRRAKRAHRRGRAIPQL